MKLLESEIKSVELCEMIFVFNLTCQNFKALNFCGINLKNDVLRNKTDFDELIDTINKAVSRVADDSSVIKTEDKEIASEIRKVAKDIMLMSISIFETDGNDMLKTLHSSLKD